MRPVLPRAPNSLEKPLAGRHKRDKTAFLCPPSPNEARLEVSLASNFAMTLCVTQSLTRLPLNEFGEARFLLLQVTRQEAFGGETSFWRPVIFPSGHSY